MTVSGSSQQRLDDAMAALHAERDKLRELGKLLAEGSTTVRAKDHSLEMTFDGRGELVALTFNAQVYRGLAPAELANSVLETLRTGRQQAQQKMTEVMGVPAVPGLDIAGLNSGDVRPDQMLDAMLGPMLDQLGGTGLGIDVDSLGQRMGINTAKGQRDA